MNQKELKELIEFLIDKDVAEFELERGDVKVRLKRRSSVEAAGAMEPRYVAVPAAPVAAIPAVVPGPPAVPQPAVAATAPPAAAQPEEEAGLHLIHSPIVGTFYEAPSPGAPPFVKVGDEVSPGQVLCIIEAMKLMNEIEADVGGVIVKRFANNAQPVEYGQALFSIRPR